VNAAGTSWRIARIGGALYLFIVVAALFEESFVRGKLIVSGGPAATAGLILDHETLCGRGEVAGTDGVGRQSANA
jgi:hypothetical protein